MTEAVIAASQQATRHRSPRRRGQAVRRYDEAQRFRGIEIDRQSNLGALLDGEFSRFGALENFSDIDPCLLAYTYATSVTNQTTDIGKDSGWINRGYLSLRSYLHSLHLMAMFPHHPMIACITLTTRLDVLVNSVVCVWYLSLNFDAVR